MKSKHLQACIYIHNSCLVFTEKINSNGEVTRTKVRVVAKGFTEAWGEDYMHPYSPTLGCDSLFTRLGYVASHDLEIYQLDAVAAYLNSVLMEVIYLKPPEGIPTNPGLVW